MNRAVTDGIGAAENVAVFLILWVVEAGRLCRYRGRGVMMGLVEGVASLGFVGNM
jgi:hypothetical protein